MGERCNLMPQPWLQGGHASHPRLVKPYVPPRPAETNYAGSARPAPEGVRVLISNTWDGQPCERSERVAVTVKTVGEEVVITVDAPFYNDSAPDGPVGPTDKLWDHEVVEVFFLCLYPVPGPGFFDDEPGFHRLAHFRPLVSSPPNRWLQQAGAFICPSQLCTIETAVLYSS